MRFFISQRNDEGMDSIAFAIDIELGPNHRKVCTLGSGTDPKFHCVFGGRVDDELPVFMVVVSFSLKVLDV